MVNTIATINFSLRKLSDYELLFRRVEKAGEEHLDPFLDKLPRLEIVFDQRFVLLLRLLLIQRVVVMFHSPRSVKY